MPERHTVDFDRVSFNILSDAARGVVTLQFDRSDGDSRPIKHVLKVIDRRFGMGVRGRLNRWIMGERNPLRLTSHGAPHPENPDVIRCELAVSPGEPMDLVLANLIDFFRRQPGYLRTFGAPLDRDETEPRPSKTTRDISESATGVLRQLLGTWGRNQPGTTDGES